MKRAPSIRIGGKTIGHGQPVFIIAEAGVNHNGTLSLALKLVDAAKEAGADAVKFQNFKAEEVTTEGAEMAEYQKKNTGKKESQIEMIKRLELSDNDFKKIAAHAKKRGIIFLSAPHGGFASIDLLQKLKVPAFKFGSADLNNLPMLGYAAKFKKPMIVSTGMAQMSDIAEAVKHIRTMGNNNIVVFQCITDYPSNPQDINLRAMCTIEKKLNVLVGYSDHSLGAHSAIVATALGARVLEKHLTLDNKMQGPDHKASANTADFKKYVEAVRTTEVMLGSAKKTVAQSAKQYMPLVLKSLVAARPIKKGEKFSKENLAIKRPAKGLPPKFYFKAVGKRATRDLARDAYIRQSDYGN